LTVVPQPEAVTRMALLPWSVHGAARVAEPALVDDRVDRVLVGVGYARPPDPRAGAATQQGLQRVECAAHALLRILSQEDARFCGEPSKCTIRIRDRALGIAQCVARLALRAGLAARE